MLAKQATHLSGSAQCSWQRVRGSKLTPQNALNCNICVIDVLSQAGNQLLS